VYVLAIRCFIHPFIYDPKSAAEKQTSRSRGWSYGRQSASATVKRLNAEDMQAHLAAAAEQIARLGSLVCALAVCLVRMPAVLPRLRRL
jgi:hypothetical protein